MGSFNTTCFASMQTIASGDECFIIPIIQKKGYRPVEISRGEQKFSPHGVTDSTCYCTAFWKPIGRPVSAVYDDYGRVVIHPTVDNMRSLSSFYKENKKRFFKTEEGENSSHDLAYDPETIEITKPIETTYDMWDVAVHEHRVFIADYDGNPCQFQWAIISKEAVNNLVKYVENSKNYDKTSNKIEAFIKRLEVQYEEILADNGKLKPEKDDAITRMSMRWFLTDRLFDRICNSGEGYQLYAHDLKEEIMDELKGQISFSDSVKIKLTNMIREYYIYSGLIGLNIKIQPMFYASQDYDNSIGKEYSKFVLATSAAMTKFRKKMYEDY